MIDGAPSREARGLDARGGPGFWPLQACPGPGLGAPSRLPLSAQLRLGNQTPGSARPGAPQDVGVTSLPGKKAGRGHPCRRAPSHVSPPGSRGRGNRKLAPPRGAPWSSGPSQMAAVLGSWGAGELLSAVRDPVGPRPGAAGGHQHGKRQRRPDPALACSRAASATPSSGLSRAVLSPRCPRSRRCRGRHGPRAGAGHRLPSRHGLHRSAPVAWAPRPVARPQRPRLSNGSGDGRQQGPVPRVLAGLGGANLPLT